MSGYKTWGIGEVVEAGDFQSYIQNQTIMKFADAAARTSALGTAVVEGMLSYLVSTGAIEYYTGAVWSPVSNPGDITAVTAGTALTGGGTTGDVSLDVDIAAVGSAVSITAAQISDVTATAAELNILDGVTATTAELNYTDGVTSNIQTQLDGKVSQTNGTVTTATAGSAVVRNITLSTAVPTTEGTDGDVWLVYTP